MMVPAREALGDEELLLPSLLTTASRVEIDN